MSKETYYSVKRDLRNGGEGLDEGHDRGQGGPNPAAVLAHQRCRQGLERECVVWLRRVQLWFRKALVRV